MNRLCQSAVLAVLVLACCEPENAAAADATAQIAAASQPQSPPQKPLDSADANQQPNNDCWWYEPGDRSLVAVWVSPRLPGQVPGGFRFVNVFLHDAGEKPGLLLHSSPVHSDRRDEVGIASDGRSIQVTPVAGKNWSQVLDRKHVQVLVDRK